ncbi:hypothetical protein EHV15_34810 [Paenibacillus oralis]|uniref:Uncharacterized protein n=1 Tax=Paenibacillus oralis TaxID=2490856 RepID=A0A3P3T9Q2_9BACL|nr:hypothetical protein [Paenibacillus oralis]RRJ54766.1 hypothetical protein EHV15_34810 [Paenibacillus oralis]
MSQSYRFKFGNLKGEIKPAENNDNPGELMIVGMPLVSNIHMSTAGAKEVDCPLCGKRCWASPHLPEAVKMFAGRVIAACTECSLRANLNKGVIPKRLHEAGLHPDDLLQPILKELDG